MVGIIVVSHSHKVAIGACALALQMTGEEDVLAIPAGGTDDGEIGTSIDKVSQAIEQVLAQGDALILVDLGSAVMIAQMVIEMLPSEDQKRVRISNAPLVEGAIAAVVAAAGGGDLNAVQKAAEQALKVAKVAEETAGDELPPSPPSGGDEPPEWVELTIRNPTGLHARPAARFVRTAMQFESDITVQNVTHKRPSADAQSVLDVASRGTAWQGERIRIEARGPDAAEAIAALQQLVEDGFGEMETPEPPAREEETAEEMAEGTAEETLAPKETLLEEARPLEAGERLQGIPASEGVVVGPALLYRPPELSVERRQVSDPAAEIERLDEALRQSRAELTNIQQEVAQQDAQAGQIFEFQRMMLEDPALVDSVKEEIQVASCNAEAAVSDVIDQWAARFDQAGDELMRLRAADVHDVRDRVLRILLGVTEMDPLAAATEPVIVLAHDLTPSDTARFDRERMLGLCTAGGGATSHVAILARMWNLPAVVGLGERILQVTDGVLLAIDGETGVVEVEPADHIVQAYREREERQAARWAEAMRQVDQPAITKDGQRVEIVANVGDAASAREALAHGAEGVGLLRTEFLYLDRSILPSEDEQVDVYRAIADVMGQRPVIVRTLDVGGDKPLPSIPRPEEDNPALGIRAIRLSQRHPDLLTVQLRAILRAGAGYNLKVMFPLIATLAELRWAKALMRQAKEALNAEGAPHAQDMEIGVMVETPAAALMVGVLADEVDFFSVGSNDLTQYTLACDRGSGALGDLYNALDPAVIRLIARTIEGGHTAGKWVGVCGELAGQRLAIPVLLGLGLDEFSMTPRAIPIAKQLIRSLTMAQARQIADHALSLSTASEIEAYLSATVDGLL